MSGKASVVRGSAVVWAVLLIAAFIIFAGVSVLMPSTKSGRIHSPRDAEADEVPTTPMVEATTQPVT
ncbi:MAG: hypothetical protein WBD40_12880 [Tepidisphaeraceae bacterium]